MNNIFAKPVLFFDGSCNLCNGAVQFILKHDRRKEVQFASLQWAVDKDVLPPTLRLQLTGASTFVLYRSGKWYTRSAAALRVARLMGWPWGTLYVFVLVPAVLRDAVYAYISANRYKWFGKSNACMIPTAEYLSRFVGT